jgi:hypothetical protein
MMKFPDFGKRRFNNTQIESVSNAEVPVLEEDTLEDEMANLSAEEAAEIRDAFNVILHSDLTQDPMLGTVEPIDRPLAADLLAVDDSLLLAVDDSLAADPLAAELASFPEAQAAPPMAVEEVVMAEAKTQPSLLTKLNLDVTPLVIVPTVITEPIEQLIPTQAIDLTASSPESALMVANRFGALDIDLPDQNLAADGGMDLELTADDLVASEDPSEETSYDVHTDGPLTYFQYYLDGDSGESAEYNPVALRRPSMPTGLVGAGILGAALISGFSIADAMKQGQPVAKRPAPSPLQDLKNQTTPPPVVPTPPESMKPEISALPPAPEVNQAAPGSIGPNLPVVTPPAPSSTGINQPTYSLQQGGAALASIAPVSNLPQTAAPDRLNVVQSPLAPINPPILPPPPLPSGILSEPQPVVVSELPAPEIPSAQLPSTQLPSVQPGAIGLQPLAAQGVATPEVIAQPPETTAPARSTAEIGILPRPSLPNSSPVAAPIDRLSSATTPVKETTVFSGSELVFDRKPMPPGALQSPQPAPDVQAQAAPVQAGAAVQSLLTPPQNKGFLAEDTALRSLNQQEAAMLTQANIEPFTKRTLAIRDYARAYQVASKQVNGLPPFGFIDYQQKTIILPDESSTVSTNVSADPAVPQS